MRDGIAGAHKGLPSIAFVTEEFWNQGDFVATAQGMPEVPRVKLPHPIAGTGQQAMATVANDIVDEIISKLSDPTG